VVQVAEVAATVAALAVVSAVLPASPDDESSYGSAPSEPGRLDACPTPECYVDDGVALERARFTALDVINQYRTAEGLAPFVLDSALCDDAQFSSRWLAVERQYTYDYDYHFIYTRANRGPIGIGIQFRPKGYGDWTMGIEAEVEGALSAMIQEGLGGTAHDNLLSPRWRRVGIGLSNPGGRLYLALDFSD
jgi:hypothetical protein